VSSDAFIKQAERNINLLLTEKKYREAYQKCDALLQQFPDDTAILSLKERVESDVKIENDRVISVKLDKIAPLWGSGDYALILKELKGLLKLDANSAKLNSLYKKAQKLYAAKVKEMEEDFQAEQKSRLQKLFEESPDLLLDELFSLDRNNPGNPKVYKLTTFFRDKIIKQKIDSKAELVYSDRFDAIANFISELKRIDEKNVRIAELESMLRHWRNDEQFNQKSEFIYNGRQHLETLMKLKKYDKAMQVAKEILKIDINNKFAKKILKRAERGFFLKTRDFAIKSIESSYNDLDDEYNVDKNKFIKL